MNGVSVIICCYNSAERLPQTLKHLEMQQVPAHLPWEIILVDNASTDATAQIARDAWPASAPAPLTIVREDLPGLSHARLRGLAESKYGYLSFVDDDNWVCANWVQTVADLLTQHPEVGACGGVVEGVYDVEPPWWFEQQKNAYAIGNQAEHSGDVTLNRGYLWGTGLSIRKTAWTRLVELGFRSILIDRKGTSLSSGGDSELCAALSLAGWRLWYDPNLYLKHFVPCERMTWSYARCLYFGFGMASVGLAPYYIAASRSVNSQKKLLGKLWLRQLASSVVCLVRQCKTYAPRCYQPGLGQPEVLDIEYHAGRMTALLRQRYSYDHTVRKIAHAAWARNEDS